MPKMKTHSGTSKRVRQTGSGKLVHDKGRRQTHLMQKQSTGRSRLDSDSAEVSKADKKRVKRLLGK
jgi:large subunit ribosomal protein L35